MAQNLGHDLRHGLSGHLCARGGRRGGQGADDYRQPRPWCDQGFICDKVRQYGRRVYSPDRLLHPTRRAGTKGSDKYVRISWDEAISEIAKRFQGIRREWGGEAILLYHYGGSNGILSDGGLDGLYFARPGASRLDKTICAVPTTQVALGMYGEMRNESAEGAFRARSDGHPHWTGPTYLTP